MKFRSKRLSVNALRTAVVCVLAAGTALCQTPAEKPLMVEDVFKNVQVLKGIPVNEFMDTMGFFSAAIGENCTGCHVAESLQDQSKFAEDVPRKRRARQMILMVNNFNKIGFSGRRALTCWTCHRGTQAPETIPSLMAQYTIAPEDANAIEIVPDAPTEPTADQVLDKYIQAIGGAQKAASLTSFVAKGTIEGYDTYHMKVPVELYAKATPQAKQRVMISHTQNGDSTDDVRRQSRLDRCSRKADETPANAAGSRTGRQQIGRRSGFPRKRQTSAHPVEDRISGDHD